MTWKKNAAGIFCWGIVSLAFGQNAAPPETFRLSYGQENWTRLTISQNAVYRQDIKNAATDKTPAREIHESQNIGYELAMKPLSKNADGSLRVEVTYRKKWCETSRDGSAPKPTDYSFVPGKKITFRLLPDGTVQEVKGFESFPESVEPVSQQRIGNSDFALDIQHLFPRIPDKPLSLGSTWEETIPQPANARTQEPSVFRYQVLSRVNKNGEDCLRIVATNLTKGTRDEPMPEGGTQQVDFDSDRIDVIYFSLKKGMIVAKSLAIRDYSKARRESREINEIKTLAVYECAVTFD